MDTQERLLRERIAQQQIEEERFNREIKYLTPLQKKTFLEISKGRTHYESDSNDSKIGVILSSLEKLGLIQLSIVKGEMNVHRITTKGKLLLLENPKLRFPLPEFTRWVITTAIAVAALLISLCLLLK